MNRLAPYTVINASVVRHGALKLTFADGLSGTVKVLPHMWGPVFERARTEEGFADTLYERVRTGVWPSESIAI